ncbi:phosphatidylserine decarboxylase [Besnoitia besnoiti]|uniref:Phosphatidylserine decarboxylase n=1 Tax=Besnoitia besnoiti TaxID=94643 RepID=A0A2A9MCR7_BESBE|nr:phosphatidylserine decarboxylase [Besnoitia besnoiti]PFH35669.1 phosphatidylserine decarboxylase [Besnoitia besnoiti]
MARRHSALAWWLVFASLFLLPYQQRGVREKSFVLAADHIWNHVHSVRLVFTNKCSSSFSKYCGVTQAELKFPADMGKALTVADLIRRLEHLLQAGAASNLNPGRVAISHLPTPRAFLDIRQLLRLRPGLRLPPELPASRSLESLSRQAVLVHPRNPELGKYVSYNEISFDPSFLDGLPKIGYPVAPVVWIFSPYVSPTSPGSSSSNRLLPLSSETINIKQVTTPTSRIFLTAVKSSPFVTLQSLLSASSLAADQETDHSSDGGPSEGEREEVLIYTPDAEKLARLFPSAVYFPIKFVDRYRCELLCGLLARAAGSNDCCSSRLPASNSLYPYSHASVSTVVGAALSLTTLLRVNKTTAIDTRWGDDLHRLSKVVGFISNQSVSRVLISRFQSQYNIDKEEANSMADRSERYSAAQFKTLQSFFTRPINTEVFRSWDPSVFVASPADAVVQNVFTVKPDSEGFIRHTLVPQVKATTFDLLRFLFGNSGDGRRIKLQSPLHHLSISIHYLSPGDYHRCHSPADWVVDEYVYLPGCTPSVNRDTLASRDGILHHFERTTLVGHWDPLNKGENLFFAVSLVAARFVGGLSLVWEKEPLQPNGSRGSCSTGSANFTKKLGLPMCMGQEMGAFRFGSTVVLAYEAPADFDPTVLGECSHARVLQPAVVSRAGRRRPLLQRCAAFASNYQSPSEYLAALKQNPGFDRDLRANSLLPAEWLKEDGRVISAKIRALERGLLTRFALAKYLYLSWQDVGKSRVLVAQPYALVQAGGVDKLGRFPAKCFQEEGFFRLELPGRLSSVSLLAPVNGEEKLLFKHPFFGCVGDSGLGKISRGITASWEMQGGKIVLVLTLTVGTFTATEPKQIAVGQNRLSVQALCDEDWRAHAGGTTTTSCRFMEVMREPDSKPTLVEISSEGLWEAYGDPTVRA